jgi:hypothetical protein
MILVYILAGIFVLGIIWVGFVTLARFIGAQIIP